MPNNDSYVNANNPITEAGTEVFSRTWFRFFDGVGSRIKILTGVFTASATAGTASALPPTPAGYMTIVDNNGVNRKVPYYNE